MSKKLQQKLFNLLKERNQILKDLVENREIIDSRKSNELLNYRSDFFLLELLLYMDALQQQVNQISECSQAKCRLAEEDPNSFSLLVAKTVENGIRQARNEGLKEIRDFTKDAENLIIIDPYMYGGEAEKSKEYVQEFAKASRIVSNHVRGIHIIYNSRMGNTKKIKKEIKDLASENSCTLTNNDTDLIHDRIWIADRKRAIVVGTSLGGLGNRLSFILELPKYDLDALLEYVDYNNLI